MNLKDLECIESGGNIIVAGSGASVKEYKEQILEYKEKNNAKIIGINYMTFLCSPDYHLWTNKQRYRDLGDCIDSESTLLFGYGMPEELIRKHYDDDYYTVDYVDDKKLPYKYEDGVMYGGFRTAGSLAIMIADIMDVKEIHIVGMDGYTLYDRESIEKGDKSHHCYGRGYTDDASWEKCKKKDKKVYNTLRKLSKIGIKFDILTPTKFEDFYNPDILGG